MASSTVEAASQPSISLGLLLAPVPPGSMTAARIVGVFQDTLLRQHGFLDTGGSITVIDVPGAHDTGAIGINNSGQIVGFFTEASGISHGFLATPVPAAEPPSSLTSATCLVALFVMASWRKRAPEEQ